MKEYKYVLVNPNEEKLTTYRSYDGIRLQKVKTYTLEEWRNKCFTLMDFELEESE